MCGGKRAFWADQNFLPGLRFILLIRFFEKTGEFYPRNSGPQLSGFCRTDPGRLWAHKGFWGSHAGFCRGWCFRRGRRLVGGAFGRGAPQMGGVWEAGPGDGGLRPAGAENRRRGVKTGGGVFLRRGGFPGGAFSGGGGGLVEARGGTMGCAREGRGAMGEGRDGGGGRGRGWTGFRAP